MGPIQKGRLYIAQRLELRRQGLSFPKINEAMHGFSDHTIAAAVAQAGPEAQAAFDKVISAEAPSHFGDGTILKKIISAIDKFLKSDLGKAVMSILAQLLLALI